MADCGKRNLKGLRPIFISKARNNLVALLWAVGVCVQNFWGQNTVHP
jgi:hypothetical protein